MDLREKREKLENLARLTDKQVQVMYYRCLNMTVGDIADKLDITNEGTIWTRFTKIFKTLKVSGEEDLILNYSPIFLEYVKSEDDWQNWGNIRAQMLRDAETLPLPSEGFDNKSESSVTDTKAVESTNSGTTSDQSSESTEQKRNSPSTPSRNRVPWIVIAVPLLVVCLLCISALIFTRPLITSFIRPQASATILASSTAIIQATENATPLPDSTLTPVIEVTTAPSDIPLPSDTSSPSLTPTLTQAPTEPPAFFDDFEDGLDPAWTIIFGKPVVVDGQLTATESTMLSVGDPEWRNYEIQFDSQPAGCRLNLENSFLGIRVADRENMLAYSFAACDSQWYYIKNGDWSVVPNTFSGNWQGPVHFTFVATENTITLYNRANKIHSFVDTEYKMGYVILHLRQGSVLDNFEITLLGP